MGVAWGVAWAARGGGAGWEASPKTSLTTLPSRPLGPWAAAHPPAQPAELEVQVVGPGAPASGTPQTRGRCREDPGIRAAAPRVLPALSPDSEPRARRAGGRGFLSPGGRGARCHQQGHEPFRVCAVPASSLHPLQSPRPWAAPLRAPCPLLRGPMRVPGRPQPHTRAPASALEPLPPPRGGRRGSCWGSGGAGCRRRARERGSSPRRVEPAWTGGRRCLSPPPNPTFRMEGQGPREFQGSAVKGRLSRSRDRTLPAGLLAGETCHSEMDAAHGRCRL